jgi:beta-xylosidase
MKDTRRIAAVAAALFSLFASAAVRPASAGDGSPRTADTSSRRPIFLADPTIFYDSGVYYLYGTGKVNEGFQVYVSPDLRHWKMPKGIPGGLVLRKEDVFGTGRFWAPQVFRYRHTYYMAYAADEHIAIAKAASPLGPFTQRIKAPLETGTRAIDPFVFIDGDGTAYIYFVRLEKGNRIYMGRLSADLSRIEPGTLRGCLNAVDHPQRWENRAAKTWTVTEGPTVIRHKGLYYLFYSANGFKSIWYAVGYAVSGSPEGPWKKYAGNPILDRNLVGENGPGHGDFFRSAGGYWYVFHTHFSNDRVGPRRTAVIKGHFAAGAGADRMVLDKASFYYLKTR